MTNKLKGEVSFTVPGEPGADEATYTLVYSFDALCELEDELDQSVIEVIQKMLKGQPRLRVVAALLRVGLQAKHPGLTAIQAQQILMALSLPTAMETIAEAVQAAFPAPEAATGAKSPRRPPGP